jgi:uncharacterized coiled-coil protein SlyX
MTRNKPPQPEASSASETMPDTPAANTPSVESLLARVAELESLHTHLQQTIDELNSVVVAHERRVHTLERSIDQLAGRVTSLADTLPGEEEPEPPPPHY